MLLVQDAFTVLTFTSVYFPLSVQFSFRTKSPEPETVSECHQLQVTRPKDKALWVEGDKMMLIFSGFLHVFIPSLNTLFNILEVLSNEAR